MGAGLRSSVRTLAPLHHLELDQPGQAEHDVTFDAFCSVPEALQHYGWHAHLRAPAHAAARRTRRTRHVTR